MALAWVWLEQRRSLEAFDHQRRRVEVQAEEVRGLSLSLFGLLYMEQVVLQTSLALLLLPLGCRVLLSPELEPVYWKKAPQGLACLVLFGSVELHRRGN